MTTSDRLTPEELDAIESIDAEDIDLHDPPPDRIVYWLLRLVAHVRALEAEADACPLHHGEEATDD